MDDALVTMLATALKATWSLGWGWAALVVGEQVVEDMLDGSTFAVMVIGSWSLEDFLEITTLGLATGTALVGLLLLVHLGCVATRES